MKIMKVLLILQISTFFSLSACADQVEYAQRNDLVGFWQGIEISNQFQPKAFPSSPWPLKCQWFAFYDDGRYATYMTTPENSGQCKSLDYKSLTEIFEKSETTMFFSVDSNADGSARLLFVGRHDRKSYSEIWAAHIFKSSANIRGETYEKGDLFMRLLSKVNYKDTLWLRHLRRISAQQSVPGDAPQAVLP
jgi:hypothetical protein